MNVIFPHLNGKDLINCLWLRNIMRNKSDIQAEMRSTQPLWNSFPMPLLPVSTTSLVLMDQCYYWKSTKRLEIIAVLPFAIFLCLTSRTAE